MCLSWKLFVICEFLRVLFCWSVLVLPSYQHYRCGNDKWYLASRSTVEFFDGTRNFEGISRAREEVTLEMEVNEANLGQLAVYLQQTLSPQAEVNCFDMLLFFETSNLIKVRKPAEDFLTSVETNQNYPVLLLSLLNSDAGELNIKVTTPF